MTIAIGFTGVAEAAGLEVVGVTVTPHMKLDSMHYRRAPEAPDGARVEVLIQNASEEAHLLDANARLLFNGVAPAHLLESGDWAWHDTPPAHGDAERMLAPGAATVWRFNSKTAALGPGSNVQIEYGPEEAPWLSSAIAVDAPEVWLSAVTLSGEADAINPDLIVVHIANESGEAITVQSCRLWLPADGATYYSMLPQTPLAELDHFDGKGNIPARDRGGFTAATGLLPRTYAAVEVQVAGPDGTTKSLWGYVRIKPEVFDISGGWVNGGNHVTSEPFLKALKRLHINTAHLGITSGYSDTELYTKYPLKYFGELRPFDVYDTDAMLPRIHAAEFLGEPQYGGGKPVPPQEVWEKLQPYATTRLHTTVTHSEERIWRDYAGLSDYPHYDAYRVTAPSADLWRRYDRWGGPRIGWGAPLETIGDMCRSLRELNRPRPCAIWSQGPHEGWDVYGGRKRTSPTPDEIRSQAYHALSTRITSLYWFNLSLKTLVLWRDTLDELGRIGREMRMLDTFYIEGDAYRFERLTDSEGNLDWDIASVAGPKGAVLFALDLAYEPDLEERVFTFDGPRDAEWQFALPAYLGAIADVFRVDADGVHDVTWEPQGDGVKINDRASVAAVYVAAPNMTLRSQIEKKRQSLIEKENALNFDPARNDADFNQLKELAREGR